MQIKKPVSAETGFFIGFFILFLTAATARGWRDGKALAVIIADIIDFIALGIGKDIFVDHQFNVIDGLDLFFFF